MENWYDIPTPETSWLVDGLLPSDGQGAICGKPKAGKSTFVRNLVTAVINGGTFLGRSIDVAGIGRVLYVHLDRKDQPWRVSKELRDLGITQEASSRLVLKTAADVPADTFDNRLTWLQREVVNHNPHLVVIDLMWQFVIAKNSNDYTAVLEGINRLQDALTAVKYKGALVVTLHSRKATNPDDAADDMLGSTGQRGSFATNIFLARHRNQGVYTVMSEQTVRDDHYGEIDETVIIRHPDGTLSLGSLVKDLVQREKKRADDESLDRLVLYISEHPGTEMPTIVSDLKMSKPTILRLLAAVPALWRKTGTGVKGDPHKYYVTVNESGERDEVDAGHDPALVAME
jgi:hypothetical protein